MRLISCEFKGEAYLGVKTGEKVFLPSRHPDWNPAINSMLALIDAGPSSWSTLHTLSTQTDSSNWIDSRELRINAPIPRPRQNVMCLGWNYVEHVAETAQDKQEEVKLPRSPIVFTKAANCVNGPFADIAIDLNISAKMDWESELAIVIGKGGRGIAEQDALCHVFGYTVINDVTARDRQKWHKQFFIGKSFSGCCPMGPYIVTADEIEDPQNLNIRSWVNGELKQDSNTKYQIFNIAKVIAVLSQGMELEAGDVIATGTPSGVGYARTPPEYLLPGDVVECEVENIGKIRNKIVAR